MKEIDNKPHFQGAENLKWERAFVRKKENGCSCFMFKPDCNLHKMYKNMN